MKKLINCSIVFLALFFMTMTASAQSMTDDQVIQYVQQQQERGRDQKQIVTDLLKKGVTAEQLRRIRKKYEQEKNSLGASDLTGKNNSQTSADRSRKRQQTGEDAQMKNNYMRQGQYRNSNEYRRSLTRKERLDELNDEIGFLDIDSLLYYQRRFLDESAVFGRNIFNNELLSFEPSGSIATPANYRLGAGDYVYVDVWGASQQTFEGAISPDGSLTIAGIGPVKLAGMSISEANAYLKNRVGQYFNGSDVQISVGETRTVQVQVLGEVLVPGTYTLSALSTSFNALYAAGGINEIGTLRNIYVYRQGRKIATIDVYDYLINGNQSGDVRLNDNDVIIVGPYECLVQVRGKVKRPMFYEMKSTESVKTVLAYAGGFKGDAYKKNIRLVRKDGAEYSVHTIGEFEQASFKLADGDSLFVDSVVARYSNMAEVRGAVFHPGMYEVGGKISTVRELIEATAGLREDAFTNRAVMHRQKEDMTLEVVSVDVLGIMSGKVADIPLRKNDVLFIPSKLDMRGEEILTIDGEVNFPGTYVYADNTTVEDLVLQAGGLTDAASVAKVDVFRRIVDSNATEASEQSAETFSFALKEGFVVDGEQGFVLKPYDMVVVRKSPSYMEQQQVTIEGCVNFPGAYAMTTKNYRLSDLVKAAGNTSTIAYVKGARLERQMTDEEKKQAEATLRTSQIALYEESMSSENKNFDLARADSLLQMKLDIGNTFPVAIDLEAAMKNPGSEADITLRENDRIIVPQYSSVVKISGDVMYPTSMNYKQGESLNYYIKRAGGYGDNARKSRVYAIYANGSVELLKHGSKKAIQPGCQIVVPSKKNKQKMTIAEYSAIGTSAASMATMMVTIANLLK